MMRYPAAAAAAASAAQWYLLYSFDPSCPCQVDQDHHSVNPSSQQHTSDSDECATAVQQREQQGDMAVTMTWM
ncbi:unnamed protein product [Wuchereria bancrofti]|uniref:Uncharacterized protein n=1 Tax=Wuchereria bancrofti TaxID=6293 RepID=A0A3P7G625_WUCBA|nr:unnamed protein product [Wuchereria bancrofti]